MSCRQCGGPMPGGCPPQQKICSDACRQRRQEERHARGRFAWRHERQCAICDATFMPRRARGLTCSPACCIGLNSKKKRKPSISVQCTECDAPFITSVDTQATCSRRCSVRRERRRRGDRIKVMRRARIVKRECIQCSAEFTMPFYPRGGGSQLGYCSDTCRRQAAAERMQRRRDNRIKPPPRYRGLKMRMGARRRPDEELAKHNQHRRSKLRNDASYRERVVAAIARYQTPEGMIEVLLRKIAAAEAEFGKAINLMETD